MEQASALTKLFTLSLREPQTTHTFYQAYKICGTRQNIVLSLCHSPCFKSCPLLINPFHMFFFLHFHISLPLSACDRESTANFISVFLIHTHTGILSINITYSIVV